MKPPKNHNRHINMPARSDVAYLYFKIVAIHTLALSRILNIAPQQKSP